MNWETAYDNRRAVSGAEALPGRWAEDAAAFRDTLGTRAERIAYGLGTRQIVDLFHPLGAARGLAVFVHGGYWQRNAPELFSHFAAGALGRGWSVAMPGYTLCPDAQVSAISIEIGQAIAAAADRVAGSIRLAGHSAGGHLAARAICGAVLPEPVRARVAGVLSISGLHDLRPLLRTPMNDVLRLELATARAESPALLEPAIEVPVTAWVGGEELTELRRQSRVLAEVWGGLGLDTRFVERPGKDHFTVIDGLRDPEAPIVATWLGLSERHEG
ncbi:MAG: alpha/beta hydrolase [Paracoccaceae bacterium]